MYRRQDDSRAHERIGHALSPKTLRSYLLYRQLHGLRITYLPLACALSCRYWPHSRALNHVISP